MLACLSLHVSASKYRKDQGEKNVQEVSGDPVDFASV